MVKKSFSLKIQRDPRDESWLVVHKSHGKRSGLGVCKFISLLLEINETLPNYRKLTDDEIQRLILEEFPNRKGLERLKAGKITIGYYRTLYNSGRLSAPYRMKPTWLSNRYAKDGILANRRTGRPCFDDVEKEDKMRRRFAFEIEDEKKAEDMAEGKEKINEPGISELQSVDGISGMDGGLGGEVHPASTADH